MGVPARSGAETLPTAFVTRRPLPSTSCSRTPSRGCSRSTTRIPTLACLQPPKSPAVLLPEVLQTHWCTLSSMCVPSLAPTLARLRSTLVWRIVWRKLRRRVASSLSTMVFLHHLSASSSTEVFSSVCRTSLRLSTHTSMMSLWSESCPSSSWPKSLSLFLVLLHPPSTPCSVA